MAAAARSKYDKSTASRRRCLHPPLGFTGSCPTAHQTRPQADKRPSWSDATRRMLQTVRLTFTGRPRPSAQSWAGAVEGNQQPRLTAPASPTQEARRKPGHASPKGCTPSPLQNWRLAPAGAQSKQQTPKRFGPGVSTHGAIAGGVAPAQSTPTNSSRGPAGPRRYAGAANCGGGAARRTLAAAPSLESQASDGLRAHELPG